MSVNVTNIVDYQGSCIKDYQDTCIILSKHVPVFGCGAVYARIWQAGHVVPQPDRPNEPDIRLISEL